MSSLFLINCVRLIFVCDCCFFCFMLCLLLYPVNYGVLLLLITNCYLVVLFVRWPCVFFYFVSNLILSTFPHPNHFLNEMKSHSLAGEKIYFLIPSYHVHLSSTCYFNLSPLGDDVDLNENNNWFGIRRIFVLARINTVSLRCKP